MDIPLQIIDRYKHLQEDKLVFDKMNYWSMCKKLKTVMTACGIEKAISYHGYGDEIMWAFLLKYSVLSVLIVIYKIVLIVLYCIDSEPYENDYGVSPKYIIQEENG